MYQKDRRHGKRGRNHKAELKKLLKNLTPGRRREAEAYLAELRDARLAYITEFRSAYADLKATLGITEETSAEIRERLFAAIDTDEDELRSLAALVKHAEAVRTGKAAGPQPDALPRPSQRNNGQRSTEGADSGQEFVARVRPKPELPVRQIFAEAVSSDEAHASLLGFMSTEGIRELETALAKAS